MARGARGGWGAREGAGGAGTGGGVVGVERAIRREAGGERQVSRKDERRVEAEARRREAQARKPFEKKLAAIEAELEPLQAEATAADAWLASSEAYEEGQRERMQECLRRQGEIRARISALEDDWLWTQAQIDQEVNRARE